MGKYDNVTMKEYMKKKKEMLNDLGRVKHFCDGVNCRNCPFNLEDKPSCSELEIVNLDKALEIVMEYEPKVDWSKVEVDTKILVKSLEMETWFKRHFAKYYNGVVYTYPSGLSSFTYNESTDGCLVNWDCAKLYKGDE